MKKTVKVHMAPMAGITDRAFRELALDYGADYVTTEMVSAKGLYYEDTNTGGILDRGKGDRTGVQIFGSDPEIIREIVKRLSHTDFAFIDFNMGCPAPKIFKNGDGSALMQRPDLAYEILAEMVNEAKKPVHLKIRLGVREDEKNYLEIAKMAQRAGVAALCLHPRTRTQYYKGQADWQAIKVLVNELDIPVIGNGDITDGASALAMVEETGCQDIMVGRAALGRPYIFEEIRAALEGRDYQRPGIQEIYKLISLHYEKVLEYKGPRALVEMRKHIGWYLRGLPGSARVKDQVNKTEDMDDIREILENYFISLEEDQAG